MRSPLKAAVPLAVAASLVAVAPAAAADSGAPKAHAAGGDVVTLTYPTLVQSRVNRTEHALKRATKQIEAGDLVTAAATFKTVRRQMSSAWRGAKYIVRTTPPPPAEEASADPGGANDVPPTGTTFAAPADSAFLVLALQHEVASAVVQLIDGSHGTGLDALSTTLNFTLDRRDAALNDILALAPPAPPAEDARVHAHASDEPTVDTFDIVMPNVAGLLTDELQAIEGTKSDATDLTAGGRRLLDDAETQITKTSSFVNTNWPPVPAED